MESCLKKTFDLNEFEIQTGLNANCVHMEDMSTLNGSIVISALKVCQIAHTQTAMMMMMIKASMKI